VKKVGLKGVTLVLILSLFIVAIVVQVRAEEECHVAATIHSPEPFAGAQLGYMVTFNDGILVVSDKNAKVEGVIAGKAYIYDSEGNLKATLQSPEPEDSAGFSYSLDVSGDTIVIGQDKHLAAQLDAYVFNPDGSLLSTLRSPAPEDQNSFGYAVAVDGDIIVVSDPAFIIDDKAKAGIVYVYDSEGSLLETIQSPTPGINHWFGRAVTVGEDVIVIGEVVTTGPGQPVGPSSAYIYDYDGNLIATLKPPEGMSPINYGNTVDIQGGVIAVGDSWAEVDGKIKAGRVYLYDREGNLLRTIQAPEPQEAAHFGSWVDISGDKIAIGEWKADIETINEGRAYLFDTDGNLLATLQAPEPEPGAYFGWAVAVYGDIVVVVARNAEVEGLSQAGKVYIFKPGAEAESEAEAGAEAKAEPEPEQEQPEEPKPKGIPGFPYESIILGLAVGAIVIWLLERRR